MTGPTGARRPRILFYAMYPTAGMDSAPKVRITMLRAELGGIADVTTIEGTRGGRLGPAMRWVLGGGWRHVDAVYVEASSSTAMPWDMAVLLAARLARRPVGVYFRDAYWQFRHLYPFAGLKARLLDALMRLTHPVMRSMASRRFVPSAELGRVLGMPGAVLLPPGTDPSMPVLGAVSGTGDAPLVAAVISPTAGDGLDRLWAAMTIVRETRPDARLRLVSRPLPTGPWAGAPWLEVVVAGRDGLADALRDASLVVIPLPRSAYHDLAVPLRTFDLVGFGKPIVATRNTELERWFEPAGAALLVDDTAEALAAGIVAVLDDDALAADLGSRARALAEREDSTWAARARTLLEALLPGSTGDTAARVR